MKKIVLSMLFALCLPLAMMAQSSNDDLYYVPSKDSEKTTVREKAPEAKKEVKKEVNTNVYVAPGSKVVIQDRKGNTRDVDEYNRRYSSKENDFVLQNDTLYVKEKEEPELDGEWVNGFTGSEDDYEYAERIIRFRNPRFAIHISSPLYWDIVYGVNSWDWNVYTDGFYAYAFPTYTNRLWWDWRFNSFGYGWGSWNYPYYYSSWYPGWNSWFGFSFGGSWGGGYHGGGYWGHPHYGGGHWADNRRDVYYNNRRSAYANDGRSSGSSRRSSYVSDRQSTSSRTSTYQSGNSSRRVVCTREVGSRVVGERPNVSSRTDASSSRRTTYTRPSSTRSSISYESVGSDSRNTTGSRRSSVSTGSSERSNSTYSRSNSTYSRGSSSEPRSYSSGESRRSYNPGSSSSSSSRSYNSGSSSSSRSSGGSYSGGSSSRSSGGSSSSSSSSSRSSGSSRR